MFTPALQKLIKRYPKAKIDFLIFQKIAAEPIKRHPNVRNIYFSDFNFLSILKILYKLRKESYDMSIITSGTNPFKAGFVSVLIDAKERIGEYKKEYAKVFYTKPVKYIEKDHRVKNNLNLMPCHNATSYKVQFFGVQNKQEINNKITIGIHIGSNPKFKLKRWNKIYFIDLINRLKTFSNVEVLLFVGPGEIEESGYIANNTNVEIIQNNSIQEVAKKVASCDIFINTDSGLGHIASCFDMEIFTIFGPAKDYKVKPYSNKTYVIKLDLKCQPCYGTKRIKLCKSFECLNNLSPMIVFEQIINYSKVLNNDK